MIINFINNSGWVSHVEMTRTVYEIISRTGLKVKLLRSLDVQGNICRLVKSSDSDVDILFLSIKRFYE